MGHTLYELDVRLREIEPPIWRTIEIPGDRTLEDVHFAIQVAMGWTNSHLHQFLIGDDTYGMAGVDDTGDLEFEDERQFRLQDLVQNGGRFVYEYDFGDGWDHGHGQERHDPREATEAAVHCRRTRLPTGGLRRIQRLRQLARSASRSEARGT